MPKQSRQFTKEINPICSTTELHGRSITVLLNFNITAAETDAFPSTN